MDKKEDLYKRPAEKTNFTEMINLFIKLQMKKRITNKYLIILKIRDSIYK